MVKQNKRNNVPLILIVLDGWGIDEKNKGNAVTLAKTPTMDGLLRKYPNTKLHAHGQYVGLPKKQVGNSEAGHMNIGAGRLVKQDVVKVSSAISDGTFYKNSAFLGAIRHIGKMKSKMHVMGMLSNGQSPHSDPGHLQAIIKLLRDHGIEDIYLHLFTDGRDSPKYASLKLIDELEEKNPDNIHIASVTGRFYSMDRTKKWNRTEKAFNALTLGKGRVAKSPQIAITESYNRGDSDEFIEPCIILDKGNKKHLIEDGDSVIFFNLRSDRSRQLTKAFVQNDFEGMNPGSFKRKKKLKHLYFTAMTDFGPDLDDVLTAFPGLDILDALPQHLGDLKQLYIAETEKYAHVTYFLNGGYSGKVAGEDQYMVVSPDVKNYDLTPAMNTHLLAKKVISSLNLNSKKSQNYDFIFLNIAAPDMLGHTGNLEAGIECCNLVDKYLGDIVKAYLSVDGTIIVTADHGNIEKMINLETGEIHTEHTTNPVPFIVINKNNTKCPEGKKIKLRKNGSLCDIAPTVLSLLDIKKSRKMKGKSLLE